MRKPARIAVTGVLVLAAVAGTGPLVGNADELREVLGSLQATAPAVRGAQVQLKPSPTQRCRRVAVVGDSLTAASARRLRRALGAAGYANVVDGQVSRRIPASVPEPYSGVRATRRIRATWGEADCWVIGLGSNDLESGAHDPLLARKWIDEQVASVTPGSRVWWVNVNYRPERGNPFDFPTATRTFNAVLDARAEAQPLLEVVDWYTVMVENPAWFIDGVHVVSAALDVRTDMTLAALE